MTKLRPFLIGFFSGSKQNNEAVRCLISPQQPKRTNHSQTKF
jgi:hypothetical protein